MVVNTLLLFRTIARFKPYYLTIFVFMPLTKLNYTTNKILYHNLRFSKRIYIKLLLCSLILVAICMQNWKLLGICNLWKRRAGTLEVYNGGISQARYTLEEYCIALFTTRFSHQWSKSTGGKQCTSDLHYSKPIYTKLSLCPFVPVASYVRPKSWYSGLTVLMVNIVLDNICQLIMVITVIMFSWI